MSYQLYGLTRTFEFWAALNKIAHVPSARSIRLVSNYNKLLCVIRYSPSRKSWMIFDTSAAAPKLHQRVTGSYAEYNIVHIPRHFPTYEAAQMWALYHFRKPS
jgi:hypothetical protein